MDEQRWPFETPRDEMFSRVVTRGRRIQMINRAMIAAGCVAGTVALAVVGMGLGYFGTVSFQRGAVAATAGPPLPYYDCPEGVAIGQLSDGDRVLLTGRDHGGSWVQVRAPRDLTDRVWIRSDFVEPDTAAELPVAACATDGELQVSAAPTTSTTEVGDDDSDEESETDGDPPGEGDDPDPTPTTVPGTTVPGTPPTTQAPGITAPSTTQGPTPTTQPPTPAPVIAQVTRSQNQIWEEWDVPNACWVQNEPAVSVIGAVVENATTVTMSWSGGGIVGSKPMSQSGLTYTANLGPFDQHTLHNSESVLLQVTVTATGPGGSSQATTNVRLYDCYFG